MCPGFQEWEEPLVVIQGAREQPGSPTCPASCTEHPHTTAYNNFPTDLGGSFYPHLTKKPRLREKRGRIQVTKLEGGWELRESIS